MKTKGVPPTIREITDIIGEEKALALMEAYGRQRWTIPVDPPCVHPWIDILGVETFVKLCFHCGGWQWTIPSGEHLRLQRRNRELAELRRQGAKIAELVNRYKITEMRVFQILKEQREQTKPFS